MKGVLTPKLHTREKGRSEDCGEPHSVVGGGGEQLPLEMAQSLPIPVPSSYQGKALVVKGREQALQPWPRQNHLLLEG